MRTLILNRDLKTLFGGVAVAAASGLLMGAALYPNLDEDKIEGPQIVMTGGGPRTAPQSGDMGLASYSGHVPDYVVGTDSLRPPQYVALAYEERAEPEQAETGDAGDVMAYEAPIEVQPANWREEPREEPRYPSQADNVAYEADLPGPPDPPGPGEEPLEG